MPTKGTNFQNGKLHSRPATTATNVSHDRNKHKKEKINQNPTHTNPSSHDSLYHCDNLDQYQTQERDRHTSSDHKTWH